MARQAKLFLIRHGETVDNVAQLYAGSRDSALTNHGVQQAMRLGLHFKALELSFTHLFSSHLQRAAKTAGLIRKAQVMPVTDDGPAKAVPEVVQLRILMEQDFGSNEGKKFNERPFDPKKQARKEEPGFVDVESKESLGRRADTFLDEHLLPLLKSTTEEAEQTIAIVSHGIMLSTLWKRLLLRLPPKSVAMSKELAATVRSSLEHLGGWSNTGYLELHMTCNLVEDAGVSEDAPLAPILPVLCEAGAATEQQSSEPEDLTADTDVALAERVAAAPPSPALAHGWMTVIHTINGKDHLKGLKRTGGGVGSSPHDASQKKIESFFKRRKLE